LRVRRDEYDVDGEGGVKTAAGEYDTEQDATSMLACMVSLLVKSDRDSRKLYNTRG
jgi:hypothetical protein